MKISNPNPTRQDKFTYGPLAYVTPEERAAIMKMKPDVRKIEMRYLEEEVRKVK